MVGRRQVLTGLLAMIVSPVKAFSQDRDRRRRRNDDNRERKRKEEQDDDDDRYAVPRDQADPPQEPGRSPYYWHRDRRGRRFRYRRHNPNRHRDRRWWGRRRRYVCIPGRWERDRYGWYWMEGYCDNPRHDHGGFHFWFDFNW